jgi:dolichol kinase
MEQADLIGLVASYIYVASIVLLGEVLSRFVFHGATAFSRKFVHVSVGMWIVGTVLLFKSWQMAVIPPLTFIVVNYVSYRLSIFKGIETKDKRNLGTVYFPISFAAVIALCWAKPEVVVASLMPMTWGDALAAIIGQRWGRHRYTALARSKSIEGSAAMFIGAFVSVSLALAAFGVTVATAAGAALVVAFVATIIEALTPWGLDNLTIPAASALLLWLML